MSQYYQYKLVNARRVVHKSMIKMRDVLSNSRAGFKQVCDEDARIRSS